MKRSGSFECFFIKLRCKHACGTQGETALHLAARNHHYSVVRVLLENRADTDKRSKEGRCPLVIGPAIHLPCSIYDLPYLSAQHVLPQISRALLVAIIQLPG